MEYLIVNNMNTVEVALSSGGRAITEPEYIPVSEECLETAVRDILQDYPWVDITGIGIRTIRSFDGDVDGTFMCVFIG